MALSYIDPYSSIVLSENKKKKEREMNIERKLVDIEREIDGMWHVSHKQCNQVCVCSQVLVRK